MHSILYTVNEVLERFPNSELFDNSKLFTYGYITELQYCTLYSISKNKKYCKFYLIIFRRESRELLTWELFLSYFEAVVYSSPRSHHIRPGEVMTLIGNCHKILTFVDEIF